MALNQTQCDLLDAADEPECPVCRMAIAAVARYIESIDYELVNDPAFRDNAEPAWGFCNLHAGQWLKQAQLLGSALIYDAVHDRISDQLRTLRRPRRAGLLAGVTAFFGPSIGEAEEATNRLLRTDGRCPVCRPRVEQEHMAISSLIDGLAEPAF